VRLGARGRLGGVHLSSLVAGAAVSAYGLRMVAGLQALRRLAVPIAACLVPAVERTKGGGGPPPAGGGTIAQDDRPALVAWQHCQLLWPRQCLLTWGWVELRHAFSGDGEVGTSMRILVLAGIVLAIGATGSLAQEESCVSALQSRVAAGEAVIAAMPRLEASCSELKQQLNAFIAAEATLRKTYKSVRRACPAGEFVRADADASLRLQLIVEAANRRLAQCAEPPRQ
jgi:hypothetical protein